MSLKWYRACTVLGLSGAQKSAGWPQDFDLDSIAKLQFPQGTQNRTELIGAIQVDCANGSLKHRTTKNLVYPSIAGLSYEAAFKQALRAPVEVTANHVGASDISAWLQKQGEEPSVHLVAWFAAKKVRPVVVTPHVVAVGALGGVEPAKAGTAKPLQRTAAQDEAILSEIKKQDLDPLALPKNPDGKPGVKAAIRTALSKNSLFTGTTVFDKAWVRLTARNDIVIQG